MPAWSAALSPTQIQNVVAFLLTPVTGAQIYASHCAVCHGANRQGGLGPTLIPAPWDVPTLTSVITNGIPGTIMPAWGTLSCDVTCPTLQHSLTADQIQQVITFLIGPVTGAQMYADNCAYCHGANGQGGLGPTLNPAPGDATLLTDAITNGRGTMMPAWGSSGIGWYDSQIQQVVTFLLNWPAPTPTPTPAPTSTPAPTPTPVTGNSASGSLIYAANCASCHGANREGGIGPRLNPAPGNAGFLTQVITNGMAGIMPAWGGSLSSGQIQDVVAFLLGLPAPAGTVIVAPAPAAPPATGGDGSQLYAANCAICHGADRQGGIGPRLNPAPGDAAFLTQVISAGKGGVMPAWAGRLNSQQIDDIVQFLLGKAPATTASPTPSPSPLPTPSASSSIAPTAQPAAPTGNSSGLLLWLLGGVSLLSLGGNAWWALSRVGNGGAGNR